MVNASDTAPPSGPPPRDYRPAMLLLIAGLLTLIAASTRFGHWIDPTAGQWVFNIFGKVAILTAALALAWGPLNRLTLSPSGRVVLGGLLIAGMFFVIRPRSLLAIGPLIVLAVVVLLGLSWARSFFSK